MCRAVPCCGQERLPEVSRLRSELIKYEERLNRQVRYAWCGWCAVQVQVLSQAWRERPANAFWPCLECMLLQAPLLAMLPAGSLIGWMHAPSSCVLHAMICLRCPCTHVPQLEKEDKRRRRQMGLEPHAGAGATLLYRHARSTGASRLRRPAACMLTHTWLLACLHA